MPEFLGYLHASLVLPDPQGIQGPDQPVPARTKIVT